MPNWVSNKITFNGINESIEKIKSLILKPVEENKPVVVDFSILIPEPEFNYDEQPKEVNGEFKMPDWYEWRCTNWGTKWNASDAYADIRFNESDLTFEVYFDTAWACPEPWLMKVVEICTQLNITVEGLFADEDVGSDNWGMFTNDGFRSQEELDKRQIYIECWGIDIEEMPDDEED